MPQSSHGSYHDATRGAASFPSFRLRHRGFLNPVGWPDQGQPLCCPSPSCEAPVANRATGPHLGSEPVGRMRTAARWTETSGLPAPPAQATIGAFPPNRAWIHACRDRSGAVSAASNISIATTCASVPLHRVGEPARSSGVLRRSHPRQLQLVQLAPAAGVHPRSGQATRGLAVAGPAQARALSGARWSRPTWGVPTLSCVGRSRRRSSEGP